MIRKWRKIFKVLPVLIVQTENMPVDFGGQVRWLFIKLRKEYWDDEALIQHELTHCRWMWYLPVLYEILYKWNRRFRMWMEVFGYRTQWEYGADVDVLAYRLANYYDLNIDIETAKKAIQDIK